MPHTPGEIAYTAWFHSAGLTRLVAWTQRRPDAQACWEAAAQAVLAAVRAHAQALVAHWHAWHRDASAPALPLHTAMQALEVWLAQQENHHA